MRFKVGLLLSWACLNMPMQPVSAGLVVSVAGYGQSFDNDQRTDYDSGPIAHSQKASISGGNSAKGTIANSLAQANLVLDVLSPGLRLRANTLAVGGDVAQTNAWAVSQWGDTIRIDAAQPPPSALAVTFSIEAYYGYTLGLGQQQQDISAGLSNISLLGTIAETDPQAFRWSRGISNLPLNESASINIARGGPNDRTDFYTPSNGDATRDFASVEPTIVPPTSTVAAQGITGSYRWQQTMLIPYVEARSGYNMNVFAWLGVSSWKEGSAGVDAWNTITLDSVSYSDGTSIAGPIIFDSGFTIGIPEPSSFMLLASAIITGCSFGRKRNGD